MRLVTAVLVASLLPGCAETTGRVEDGELMTTLGSVVQGREERGEFWFELAGIEQRFVLDVQATPDIDEVIAALRDSIASGRSVQVSFDAQSGAFDPGVDVPSFAVRNIQYDGRHVEGMTGARRRHAPANVAEAALALGVAYFAGGAATDKTLPQLEIALADAGLRPALRPLALEIRGSAIGDSIRTSLQVPSDEGDLALLRALDDFRQWAILEPDIFEAQMAIGYVLSDLGAYDEALVVFAAARRRWPEESIRTTTRIAATHRIKGDYEKSLTALDELVVREGPQDGMMFHYHRGWTLNLLGRYREAISEFNRGFESQPDYPGAFERRSCAYAMLGRLPEALADRRRASELMEIYWLGAAWTPAQEYERSWSASVESALEAAVVEGRTGPMAEPCEGEWNYGQSHRELSGLLPGPDIPGGR